MDLPGITGAFKVSCLLWTCRTCYIIWSIIKHAECTRICIFDFNHTLSDTHPSSCTSPFTCSPPLCSSAVYNQSCHLLSGIHVDVKASCAGLQHKLSLSVSLSLSRSSWMRLHRFFFFFLPNASSDSRCCIIFMVKGWSWWASVLQTGICCFMSLWCIHEVKHTKEQHNHTTPLSLPSLQFTPAAVRQYLIPRTTDRGECRWSGCSALLCSAVHWNLHRCSGECQVMA